MTTTAQFVGEEYEAAYAEVFKGKIVGGFNDHGHDLLVPNFGPVQVKASLKGAKTFLAESIKRRHFIPLCIGEPGSSEEMIDSLKAFGGWVGYGIGKRSETLQAIATIRDMIYE